MILKGSQRAGGGQLAFHLMRTDENDHVELHEVSGFVAEDLKGAFREAYAISKGTRCRQYLFSVSLSPPEHESVPIPVFEAAIAEIEVRLGLTGQPRAIVFHEKAGRRHAHCVWSRIRIEEMKAVNLPHTHLKLRDISRRIYMEQGWKMPSGLVNSRERDPSNFTRAQWQQARRAGSNPEALKDLFRECWAVSDSRSAFASALSARGYYLAQGDRRGFVAVDWRGEVYAVSRWVGIRAKDVAARLGDPQSLPGMPETKARIGRMMTETLRRHIAETEEEHRRRAEGMEARRQRLSALHRRERQELDTRHKDRWLEETKARSERLSHGLRGVWDRLTGRYAATRRQNELETFLAWQRDQAERRALIDGQLEERRRLQREILQVRRHRTAELARLHRDIAEYVRMETEPEASAPQSALEPTAAKDTVQQQRSSRRSRRRDPTPAPG